MTNTGASRSRQVHTPLKWRPNHGVVTDPVIFRTFFFLIQEGVKFNERALSLLSLIERTEATLGM